VGDANVEVGIDDKGVPWDAWGPRATAVGEYGGWNNVLGERVATASDGATARVIRIRDYNPYRIRKARKDLGDHDDWVYSSTPGPRVCRRITESRKISGGEWFQEDVNTKLPCLDVLVDVPGCKAVYMEQDQILLYVDDLDKVSGMYRCDRSMMRWIAFG
jgi:hypothetical protein